jgi:hypothetical protein
MWKAEPAPKLNESAMASSAPQTYKAVLAIFSGPRSHRYDSTDIVAATEEVAIDKAWEWARNPKREVSPETRLVVLSIDGRAILNEPLDWTNAPSHERPL